MRNFAEQSLDIARHIFDRWLGAFGEDGTIIGERGQPSRRDDAGYFAHALAVCAALLGQRKLPQGDLVNAAAQCIATQFYYAADCLEGCAHAAMALLTLGVNRSRNPAWEQFPESIRGSISRWMRIHQRHTESEKFFAIIRCVAAFSMGFVDSDESDKKIENYLNDLVRSSSGGFVNTAAEEGNGRYDASGLERLLLMRELLQRHAIVYVRERRLPALRSCMQKYLRMFPMLIQGDGSSWNYGEPAGC
ncbi:MAG: hypothetical protein LBC42_02760, partial [Puniceicoccales bacterium]|nr:hypothetical protein [Puniceicoccales bacterium]